MEVGSILGNAGNVGQGAQQPQLGRDQFLELLITQLQMQDPFQPMDNEDMIAQLATFSSLEQLTNMNDNLKSNLEMDLLIGQLLNNTMATTLIGKQVYVATDRFVHGGSGNAGPAYRLHTDADQVNVKIYAEDGRLIRTLEGLDASAGVHRLDWDGKNDSGESVPEGSYRFEVTALDAGGNTLHSEALLIGHVHGIRYVDGNARVVVGDQEVPLGGVIEILSADAPTISPPASRPPRPEARDAGAGAPRSTSRTGVDPFRLPWRP